jgi:hypothetical protein
MQVFKSQITSPFLKPEMEVAEKIGNNHRVNGARLPSSDLRR